MSRAPAELAEEEDVVVDKEVEDEEEEYEGEDEDKEDEDEEEEGRERGLEVPPASVGRAMGGEGRTIHSQASPLVRPVDAGLHFDLFTRPHKGCSAMWVDWVGVFTLYPWEV